MRIEQVENVLRKGGEQLSMLPLHALSTVREPYEALLLQPRGLVEATEHRIGHADSKAGHLLCSEFLTFARDQKTDLAVAPEYSVPWSVVETIRNRQVLPADGALWVLGCESISPTDLESFATKVNAQQDSFFYHEPIDPKQQAQKAYMDPLVYIFWANGAAGEKVLTFVAQFKTTPCRDRLDVEQRSLYRGDVVYSFNRGLNKIGLLSIICSDAFDFDSAKVDEFHANCLLIHIQLNPKPAHADYAAYRTRLCSVGTNSHAELLCLNWAANVIEQKVDGRKEHWNNVAGSAWYVPTAAFSAQDELIVHAHKHGLYYSLICTRWHAFFLHFEPHILRVQKQKLLIHPAPQAIVPKTCLHPLERWTWDVAAAKWSAAPLPLDGFSAAISPYGALAPGLEAEAGRDPLAVERALELLMGPTGKPTSWFAVSEMPAVQVADEESIQRVTVHQETDETRPGVIFRRRRLQRAQDALTLPGKGVPWPAPLKDLELGYAFSWSHQAPHHNVKSLAEGQPTAALIYLADESNAVAITGVGKKISQGLIAHATEEAQKAGTNLLDAIIRAQDRLCIVYRDNHQLRAVGPDGQGRIDLPAQKSSVDIAGESDD